MIWTKTVDEDFFYITFFLGRKQKVTLVSFFFVNFCQKFVWSMDRIRSFSILNLFLRVQVLEPFFNLIRGSFVVIIDVDTFSLGLFSFFPYFHRNGFEI
jgi:hypothetical protein